MAFEHFFTSLSQTASDSDYVGIFGTTGSTLSLSANLNSLSGEGAEIVKWIRYRLGEPILYCELDNLQIYSAFEEANIEYSAVINRFQAKNWLSNFMGLGRDFTTQDFSNKLPHQTLDYLKRLANPYASEAGFGGLVNPRKAYINQTTSAQDYNLLTDFVDKETGSSLQEYIASVGGARADVRTMWYPEPSTVYRYYDPYSSTNVLANEFQYESFSNDTVFQIYPIWTDVLRAGMLETNDRVRRSNISYHIYGDRVRLVPAPNRNLKVWIDYTIEMDPFNPGYSVSGGDPSVTGVSSISNVPFRDIPYEEINSHGKRWIRRMTLGICMETLGRIRRKFISIPVPGNEVQLDGDQLVAEGIELQQELRESLKNELEETSNLRLMQQDAELAQAIEEQYQHVPFPSPILMF